MTVSQISQELDVSVARICLALEHFRLDYFELVAGRAPFRKAG